MTSVTLIGLSGRRYEHFQPYDIGADWNPVPGLYALAYLTLHGWRILYVGETGNFATRFPNHEKWQTAVRSGATHVLACVTSNELAVRQIEERDLIRAYDPVLNIEHRFRRGLLNSQPRGASLLSGLAQPWRRGSLLSGS